MNAALNVKITNLPVNSWDEIYALKLPVFISMGGTLESYFSMSPKGSIKRKIYDDIITKMSPEDRLNGKGSHLKGREALMKGNSIVFYLENVYMSLPEYPCEFTDIKPLRNPSYLAMPFNKDSPIKDLIQEVALELQIHGAVQRIWERYQMLEKDEHCEEKLHS